MNRYLDDLRKWLNCEKEISDRDISDIAVRQMWLEMRRRRNDKQKLRQDWEETVKLDKAVLIAAVGGITRRCQHDWVVFSTCITTVELMVECAKCHAFGTVGNPSKEEWGEAFCAPSNPYPWKDGDRVLVHYGSPQGRSPGASGGRTRLSK